MTSYLCSVETIAVFHLVLAHPCSPGCECILAEITLFRAVRFCIGLFFFSEVIDLEKYLRNDLFRVECGIKP